MLRKCDVVKACDQHGFYRTPSLNDRLYLHFKGITCLGDSLEEYTEVRVLWLEGNCLTTIHGIEHQKELRQLYLHQNMIECISNLDHLTHLVGLNLSDNFIKTLQGLKCLPNLQTLQLKGNRIETYDDFVELCEVSPTLSVLDLTGNRIQDVRILDVLKEMPSLACLYLHQNPVCQNAALQPYRKVVVGNCASLRYLDDRPVFDHERRTTNAWMKGGAEAEKAERKLIGTEENEKRDRNFKAFQDLLDAARVEAGSEESDTNHSDHSSTCSDNNISQVPETPSSTESHGRSDTSAENDRTTPLEEAVSKLDVTCPELEVSPKDMDKIELAAVTSCDTIKDPRVIHVDCYSDQSYVTAAKFTMARDNVTYRTQTFEDDNHSEAESNKNNVPVDGFWTPSDAC